MKKSNPGILTSREEGQLRGILFDFSGTTLLFDKFDLEAGLGEMSQHLTFPPDVTPDDFVSRAVEMELELQDIRDQTQFEFSFDKFIHLVTDYFGIRTDSRPGELEAIYYNTAVSYHAAPGIQEFLLKVKEAGVQTGIVSNSTHSGSLLANQINRNGLSDLFQFVISSSDYGIRKQHHLLYDVALSKLGLTKGQVVFIGDSLEYDIETAQAAGLTAAWYNFKGRPQTEGISPDYTFHSWNDVDVEDFKVL